MEHNKVEYDWGDTKVDKNYAVHGDKVCNLKCANTINYDRDIKGFFLTIPETSPTKDLIMGIVANFHIRDGVKHDDGSMGTMKITNRQMNDCLAYMIKCSDRE